MTDALQRFRDEVRKWLLDNCPPAMRTPYANDGDMVWGGRRATFRHPDQRLWLQRMADKGWTAPEWPPEYGGAGLSKEERRVLREEMSALRCRPPLHSFGISMLAPALFKYGSEAQRLEHLPAMARGEIRWCQGYSEPGAGSDLASLKTTAIREGDSYRVTGTKIWTSHADQSDWIFCLVRTSSSGDKRDGISFLLIDMASPGITTRPIKLISGTSPFCQVFFDEVLVPCSNLVGQEGQGWQIAKYLLTHERSMISGLGSRSQRTSSLGAHAAATLGTHDDRLSDGVLRSRIALFEIDEICFRATQERLRRQRAANPGAISSALKYSGTELNKRRQELLMEIEGQQALDTFDESDLTNVAREWLRSKANSIEGGTSEIQLNIIARKILGLG